ncbi:MAG: hypothetical protein A3H49_03975 [Nitrospirae bacterium RIFCSPLOWO2_02_FULL_62_14]|nr:MAG: hypothetical protein A3H49_03975 [Nitrospirae bacterium RIFCSPLOWO2_02_FULL_62_14]OGW69038.1 MAG: hypothetical protein A3A88_10165 [Nitrospirae bacterium RIFCSPLOWO2_01_FULL_62_17]
MKPCPKCEQQNPDDANFCGQCGAPFPVAESSPLLTDDELWRAFIGPNAGRYLEQFKKFAFTGRPRYNLTWHWPAFLFIPFLWFLYRKMYLYAFVYAVGPAVSTFLTNDLMAGLVWSIMAGVSANYVYYWHVREEVGEIKKKPWLSREAQAQAIREAGGVQPYVIGVGVVLYALFFAALFQAIQEGPTEGEKFPPARPRPSSERSLL